MPMGLTAQIREKNYQKINKGSYHIVALQETHICHRHTSSLRPKKLGKEYYSTNDTKKRGVVTYIKEDITSELKFKDTEGRAVGVMISVAGEKTLICNIYVPNGPKTKFLKYMKENIQKIEFDNLIILGDFNGIMDKQMTDG